MGTVAYTSQSRADIIDIALFVRRRNASATDRLLAAIDSTIQFLADNPTAGPVRSELAAGLRSLPVSRYNAYLIFYRPKNDGVEVVRVLHGARDLPDLLNES